MSTPPDHHACAQDPSLPNALSAVARGDRAAFRELFERTRRSVHAVAWNVLRERDGADEVVVETFERVWRSAASYEPARGSVATWMGTIARRCAFDRLRRNGLHERDAGDEELDGLACSAPGPAEESATREDSARLRSALESLSRDERRCLEAAFLGGLSYAQVAEALDQPLGTVKTRIRRALGVLRQRLPAESRQENHR